VSPASRGVGVGAGAGAGAVGGAVGGVVGGLLMSRRVRLAGRFAAGLPSVARKAAAIRAGVQYLTAAALAAVPVASCTTVLPAGRPTTPAPAWAAPACAPTAITIPARDAPKLRAEVLRADT
jgi:hypothetical protein